MTTIQATLSRPIKIGRQGENEAVRVAFDLSELLASFPGGSPLLLMQRHGDTEAYPITLQTDGDTAYWSVSKSDTDRPGWGRCELQWNAGSALVKSCTYVVSVAPALEAGTTPPDEPSKRWFEAIQSQIGDLSDLTTSAKRNLVAAINEAVRSGGGGGMPYELGETLKLVDGVLSVNTAADAEQDNTLPITSAAVYNTVGNIEALLRTI